MLWFIILNWIELTNFKKLVKWTLYENIVCGQTKILLVVYLDKQNSSWWWPLGGYLFVHRLCFYTAAFFSFFKFVNLIHFKIINHSILWFELKIIEFISVTSENDLSRKSELRNWLCQPLVYTVTKDSCPMGTCPM